MDKLNGMRRALHLAGVDIHNDDVASYVLNLPQQRVGSTGGKPHVGEYRAGHLRGLQPMLQERESFFFFGENRYSDAMHARGACCSFQFSMLVSLARPAK